MKTFTTIAMVAVVAATLAACSAQSPAVQSAEPEPLPTAFVATNGAEWTAAIEAGDIDALTSLVDEYGALAVIDGRTALQIAADAGNAEAVVLLAQSGADLTARDERDSSAWTAMHFAANSDCGPCVEALIAAGEDPGRKDRAQPSRAPIHVAASVGATEALVALLDAGVDVDSLDGASGHALLWAAYYGQTEAAQLLLDHGSDPTLVDGSTHNASTRAAGQGFDDLAALLAASIEEWESTA